MSSQSDLNTNQKPTEPAAAAQDASPTETVTGKKKKKGEPKSLKKEIMSWIYTILAAVLIACVIRAMLFEPIRVDGESMLNTLNNGEIVLVTKPEYLLGRYNRGDIVICRYPNRGAEATLRLGGALDLAIQSHTLFVKRLVALPGDTVEVRDRVLYVNGTAQDDSFIDFKPTSNYALRTLKTNEYFVMGDNRSNSHDSRASDVGPISSSMIVGHVRVVLWPLGSIRMLK
jgi:signal peptidase I